MPPFVNSGEQMRPGATMVQQRPLHAAGLFAGSQTPSPGLSVSALSSAPYATPLSTSVQPTPGGPRVQSFASKLCVYFYVSYSQF